MADATLAPVFVESVFVPPGESRTVSYFRLGGVARNDLHGDHSTQRTILLVGFSILIIIYQVNRSRGDGDAVFYRRNYTVRL